MIGLDYITQSSYNIIAVTIALIILIIGSITDIKKREVADTINYGLFFLAICLRLIYYTITLNPLIIIDGIMGFTIATIIGLAMFYGNQWGGGDSKMIIALGTLIGLRIIPLSWTILTESILISLIINIFILGSLYGLIWSIFMAIKNKNKFLKTWIEISEENKNIKITLLLSSIVIIIIGIVLEYIRFILFSVAIIIIALIYIYLFAKAVEKGTMTHMLSTNKITEGDWIEKDVKYKGKYICGPKDLGITKRQINLLKKYNIKKVLVKNGIPFIPSFLAGFIATLIWGNIIMLILNLII
jgi:archaeal preflagellin peptidase FlaK